MANSSSSSSYVYDGFGEDVMTKILSRLPVKSLLRFRCVCKFWYALIKSSHFITQNFQSNLTTLKQGNAPLFGIGFDACNVDEMCFSSINNGKTTPLDDDQVPSLDPNLLPFSTLSTFENMILGPVNGIYCAISNRRGDITMYLFNPSIREVKAIPKVPRPPLITEEPSNRDVFPYIFSRFGFGYDSKTNDYKVITITNVSKINCNYGYNTHVCLYTLRSNSWREMEDDYHLLECPLFIGATFMNHGNGVAHWLVYYNYEYLIVSFDFEKEVFLKSDTPGYYLINDKPDVIRERDICRRYELIVLNDESILLVVNLYPPSQGYNRNDINGGSCWEGWVMKEYGVKESWTKLFSTECIPQSLSLLGYDENNGELLFSNRDGQLVTYNPNSQQLKNLHPLSIRILRVCNYMESLVSIINGGY